MFKGPFTIDASETAEKIDLDALPDNERAMMTHGLVFDPGMHDVYRFFVAPRIDILDEPPSRKDKKKSFENVTRVLVDIVRGSAGVQLSGMYPTTLKADGSWELDLSANAVLNPVAPGVGSIKLSAEGKKVIRQKSRPWIKAHRTERNAQWIFFKEWLDDIGEFRFQLVCIVQKDTPTEQRYITCNAKFADDGRAIVKLENHSVFLPA